MTAGSTPGATGGGVAAPPEREPLGQGRAYRAVARCVVATARLLAARRIAQPKGHVGRRLRFADGTTGRVYRETVVHQGPTGEPCVLVVEFRLRGVRGRGHTLFRWESELNTPLFVGFPGFVSKLWVDHDERGRYRGLYEWDGAERAEDYARALWRVLDLVSVPGSIHYQVLTGLRRDDLLEHPAVLDEVAGRAAPGATGPAGAWWVLRSS